MRGLGGRLLIFAWLALLLSLAAALLLLKRQGAREAGAPGEGETWRELTDEDLQA